ncbi:MAG TPA: CoA transferase [Streptosporangiales bacterium]
MLETCLGALGLAAPGPGAVRVHGTARGLASVLPVAALAEATVTTALLAAADLAEARGVPRPAVTVDRGHVAAAFRSERHLRLAGGDGFAMFDPLSAFLPTADGWIRTHANYPQHRCALLRVLGLPEPADGADVARARDAVAAWRAVELESALVEAGGCAAAVRDEATWLATPQGSTVAGQPLLDVSAVADSPRRAAGLRPGELPASGVRVLDLTRVIAGPVGGRLLAALGADVLRVDSPRSPELPHQALDTGPGKRSALLDLADPAGRAAFEELLADADALVQGYRPGALAAFGLAPEELAERHPHLVTVTLSAWGERGPWRHRRGFDSLVQAATGIAELCRPAPDAAPGALPAQALDHGTGYLAAAAVLAGLATRQRTGRVTTSRLALARTAHALLGQERHPVETEPEPDADVAAYRQEFETSAGRVSLIGPPGVLDDRPLRWAHGPSGWGADEPVWG